MFDTLKLKVNDPDLLDKTKMIRVETIHPENKDSSIRYIYPRSPLGAYVSKKDSDDYFSIEFSAKILRDKYMSGIGIETKDLLERNISLNCLCLKGNFDTFGCEVFRADHTLNLETKNVTNIIRYLRESATWGRKMTDRRFGDSAIFFNTRENLITYDKYGEVHSRWSDFKGLDIPLVNFKNILRFEYRPKKIDVIRKSIGMESKFNELAIPRLSDLVSNYKKIIKEKVSNFKFATIDEIEDYSDFLFSSGKLDSNLKILGLYTYFKSIGFDEKVMESDIMNISTKSQRSKFRSKLKDFKKDLSDKKDMMKYKDEFLELIERAINEY